MRDDLLVYYERELTYLRQLGADFAARYPKVASRLQLEPAKCEDPHVERLLEGFAFLAARVHHKLDDDAPEISEALLGVLYPHYVQPVPSMSLVEFELDLEQGRLPDGVRVPRGSELHSRPVNGVPCRFATAYDLTVWPLVVEAAQWATVDRLGVGRVPDAVGAVRVELRCLPGMRVDQLGVRTLRLHLAGDPAVAHTLYELLLNNCVRVVARDADPASRRVPVTLPASAVRPVGFADDEAVLAHPRRSFAGYRLLREYFALPAKYLFLDVAGFDEIRAAGFGAGVELLFLVSSFERPERRQLLESGLTARSIRLACTPIVNLFPQTSEPILLTHRHVEYPVVADARRRLEIEVHSVDEVVGVNPGGGEARRFEPLYSHRHARAGGRGATSAFWHAARRPSGWRTDQGTELHLSFADLSGRSTVPDVEVVTARLTCYNGDLPSRLPFGVDPRGDFELQGGGGSAIRRVTCLAKPTSVVQPPLGKPVLWRLVSLLSLNYLSLVDEGAASLQEILRLHNVGNTAAGEREIDGVLKVQSEPTFARVPSEFGLTFARGRRIELELNEDEFPSGGVFLFATVLERFLGLYASLNTFSQLTVRTPQRRAPLREWVPRAGLRALL